MLFAIWVGDTPGLPQPYLPVAILSTIAACTWRLGFSPSVRVGSDGVITVEQPWGTRTVCAGDVSGVSAEAGLVIHLRNFDVSCAAFAPSLLVSLLGDRKMTSLKGCILDAAAKGPQRGGPPQEGPVRSSRSLLRTLVIVPVVAQTAFLLWMNVSPPGT